MLATPFVHAEQGDASTWTFGGFGTASMVRSSEHNADFSANPLTPGMAGHSHDWSADVDSRLGAQLGVKIAPRWSAVLQVVAERNLTRSYTPVVEWANIKYQATPDLSVRVGRIALPLFLVADYRKAGYALPWVRTPIELYSSLPISNSDGVDASYRWNAFGVRNETQLVFGRTSMNVTENERAHARGLAGITNTSRIGDLSVRASAMKGQLHMRLATELFDGLRQFGPQGEALAARYDTDDKRATVFSLGANYDPGAWFLMGEVARVNARSFLGDKTAGYVSGGYRFGALTPYATFSKVVSNGDTHIDGLSTAGLPAPMAAAAMALNGGLNGLLSQIAVQESTSAGLRWDFASSAAFKLQYDSVRPHGGTSGTLDNVQPGFRSGHRFGVTSVAVDFVF